MKISGVKAILYLKEEWCCACKLCISWLISVKFG